MKNILIVDDEKSIRLSIQALLTAADYTVAVAADSREALQLLDDLSVDVVVSDIVLPEVGGIELLKAIRKAAPFAQVIMMTGEPTVDTAADALRFGAFDYLTKPVNKNAMLRSVGNAAQLKEIQDDRRRLEKENTIYQEELESLVEARTAELVETLEDLRTAQDQSVKQERLNAISQMAGGISHDFNNVLMPILGMSDLLVSCPETLDDRKDALEILQVINSAAKDAREIVKRLRLIYKPSEAKYDTFKLNDLVQSAIALTTAKWKQEAHAEGREIEIVNDCKRSQVIEGNESDVREVLTNLIFNAVDAMPDGGTITMCARADGEDFVVLDVSDTGVGMDAARLQRCTEPYFTTKGEAGTGLGLLMVRSIMEHHGGRLEVESTLGIGTTIHLWFPRSAKDSEKKEGKESGPTPLPPMRILFIDDEVGSRALVTQFLKADGHTTVSAESVEEGLEAFAKDTFDLVITDRAMPNGGGDRVAKTISASHPAMPIIMLTGFGDIMKAKGEIPEGVSRVMSKPMTSRELRHVMHKVMGRARAKRV